jgi:hypothetical protein
LQVRQDKNIAEQDLRAVKRLLRSMLGIKSMEMTQRTLAGIQGRSPAFSFKNYQVWFILAFDVEIRANQQAWGAELPGGRLHGGCADSGSRQNAPRNREAEKS